MYRLGPREDEAEDLANLNTLCSEIPGALDVEHEIVAFSCAEELERLLPRDRFCRCHNSFLVNMSHIRGIDHRELELDHGGQIPVGRNYYNAAQAQFVRFLSAQQKTQRTAVCRPLSDSSW